MSNLVTSTPDKLIEAIQHAPKIHEHPNLTEGLKQIWRKALITSGVSNFNPEDVKVQVSILADILLQEHPNRSLEEVRIAAEKGVLNEFGEYYGINPKTFIGWLRSFLESKERKTAIRKTKESMKDSVAKDFTIQEAKQFWEDQKQEFLATGRISGVKVLIKWGLKLGYIVKEDLDLDLITERARRAAEERLLDAKGTPLYLQYKHKYEDENSVAFKNLLKVETIKIVMGQNIRV